MIKTELNLTYIEEELWHELRMKNVTQLFDMSGFGAGYVSQLRALRKRGEPINVTLETVDRLANAAITRFSEIGVNAPDDMWIRLIRQEMV